VAGAADASGAPGSAEGAAAGAGADAADQHQRARVHAGWRELRDDLEDFGVGCPAHESPRAVLRRVSTELRLTPAPRDALGRIAIAQERACYAARVADAPQLRRDLTIVRRAISSSVSLRTRLRAVLFPASKVSALRRSARHALDVFGWIDVATSALWRLRPTARN
jgi:hypothetical protein